MGTNSVSSETKDPPYFRIEYTARLVQTGVAYRPNAVFVTKDYRTPEGAIRGLRAILNRDARLHGITSRVEVEIHRFAHSSEDEYYGELGLSGGRSSGTRTLIRSTSGAIRRPRSTSDASLPCGANAR